MTQINEGEFAVIGVSRREAAQDWPWFVSLGILTLIAGALAVILPAIAALTIDVIIGVLLLADGVFLSIQAFRLRKWPGKVWRAISALLSLAAGIVLLVFPLAGVAALSLVVGIFFILGAFIKGALAFQSRGNWGTGLFAISAVLSLLLGLIVLVIWPDMAATALGLIVGVYLVFGGVSLLSLGFSARKWHKEARGDEPQASV